MAKTKMSDGTAALTTSDIQLTDYKKQEVVFGFSLETEFSKAIQETIVPNERDTEISLANRKIILSEHGINIDPITSPSGYSLQSLTPEDWREISEAKDPFLALWSRTNLSSTETSAIRRSYEHPGKKFAEKAFLRSLPLVHGTTLEGLLASLEDGVFVGNREVNEKGKDALGSGNTVFMDRELGLDKFVFADFGRPHMYRMQTQPEVTIIFHPKAMEQTGSFITEKDIADCIENKEYLSGLSLPEDFYAAAEAKFKNSTSASRSTRDQGSDHYHDQHVYGFAAGDDSNITNIGTASFSTWEVKMPSVDISYVKKVIFRDKEAFDTFVEKYGDTVPAIYQPELEKNLKDLKIDKLYDTVYSEIAEADYEDRVKKLEQAADIKEAYMALGRAQENPQSIETTVTLRSNPSWTTLIAPRRYPSLEKVIEVAKANQFNPGSADVPSKATRVAVAKVKYSESQNCDVITAIEWVDL